MSLESSEAATSTRALLRALRHDLRSTLSTATLVGSLLEREDKAALAAPLQRMAKRQSALLARTQLGEALLDDPSARSVHAEEVRDAFAAYDAALPAEGAPETFRLASACPISELAALVAGRWSELEVCAVAGGWEFTGPIGQRDAVDELVLGLAVERSPSLFLEGETLRITQS